MKKNRYTTPTLDVNEVVLESMVAVSLVTGDTPQNGFGGEVKDDNGWNIWN